jgi:NADH-quinone oxidoreductase subunit G
MQTAAEWDCEARYQLPQGLLRIAEQPIYANDAMLRRAAPLQATSDAQRSQIRASAATLQGFGLVDSSQAMIRQGEVSVVLPLVVDDTVADGAVVLPAGIEESMGLGGPYSTVELLPTA